MTSARQPAGAALGNNPANCPRRCMGRGGGGVRGSAIMPHNTPQSVLVGGLASSPPSYQIRSPVNPFLPKCHHFRGARAMWGSQEERRREGRGPSIASCCRSGTTRHCTCDPICTLFETELWSSEYVVQSPGAEARGRVAVLSRRKEGASEAAPEAGGQAVGGGCQSSWGAVTVGYKCH